MVYLRKLQFHRKAKASLITRLSPKQDLKWNMKNPNGCQSRFSCQVWRCATNILRSDLRVAVDLCVTKLVNMLEKKSPAIAARLLQSQ